MVISKSIQGPKKKLSKCFSCCHWNVNSILAHNKLSLLTAYNSGLNHDLICLDHPDNVKRGGVYLYYRENLTLQLVDTPYTDQCILCEINIQNITSYTAVIQITWSVQ